MSVFKNMPIFSSLGTYKRHKLPEMVEGQVMFDTRKGVLLLDLDTPESQARFWDAHRILKSMPGVELGEPLFTTSKSGGIKKHAYVTCPRNWNLKTRIAIQSFLGSDHRREILSYFSNRSPESCLVETSSESVKVKEWLQKQEIDLFMSRIKLFLGILVGFLSLSFLVSMVMFAVWYSKGV